MTMAANLTFETHGAGFRPKLDSLSVAQRGTGGIASKMLREGLHAVLGAIHGRREAGKDLEPGPLHNDHLLWPCTRVSGGLQ